MTSTDGLPLIGQSIVSGRVVSVVSGTRIKPAIFILSWLKDKKKREQDGATVAGVL